MTKNFSELNYDFMNDVKFQEYFHSQLPNRYIKRYKYNQILHRCKCKWILILNNPPLRHAYNVPMDWGY